MSVSSATCTDRHPNGFTASTSAPAQNTQGICPARCVASAKEVIATCAWPAATIGSPSMMDTPRADWNATAPLPTGR
jgi:hypothetical protein